MKRDVNELPWNVLICTDWAEFLLVFVHISFVILHYIVPTKHRTGNGLLHLHNVRVNLELAHTLCQGDWHNYRSCDNCEGVFCFMSCHSGVITAYLSYHSHFFEPSTLIHVTRLNILGTSYNDLQVFTYTTLYIKICVP